MIEFKNVSKSYKDGQSTKLVIDDLNLTLGNKGFYTFLGPSGSGKTTILNLISLLDKPSSGDILLDNKSLLSFSSKEINEYRASYIDYIFQDFNLFENETVLFNLSIITDDENKIKEVLNTVGLASYEKRKVNLLSVGEKQRVAIARSIIKDSKILLCDEPTGNLDDENTKIIFNLLKDLAKTKLVILVTHDINGAKKYSDVIFNLKNGKIKEKVIHEIKEENKEKETDIENNKIKLGLGKIIKLGLSNLKKSLGTFIITAIIVISQFAASISMISVNCYDKAEAITKTMKENQVYNSEIALYRDSKQESIYYEEKYAGPQLYFDGKKESDVLTIQNECKDNTVATEYYFNVFFDFFVEPSFPRIREDDSLYSTYFSKIVVSDNFDKFYQPLLKGRYPQAAGEIVLYDYIIDSLYHYKIIDTTNMVDKSLSYHFLDNKYELKVVGILQTPYNTFFEKYKEYEDRAKNYSYQTDEYVEEYLSSLRKIYCLKETYNKLKEFYNDDYVQFKSFLFGEYDVKDPLSYFYLPVYNCFKKVENIDSFRDKLIYFDESSKLGARSIFLTKKSVYKAFNVNSDEEFNKISFNGESGFEALCKNSWVAYNFFYNPTYMAGRIIDTSLTKISGIIDSDEICPYMIWSGVSLRVGELPFDYFRPNIFLSNNWHKNKKLIKKYSYLEKKSDAFYDSVDSSWQETKFCIFNMATEVIEANNVYLKEVRNMTNLISTLLFVASFGILFYFSFSSIRDNLYKIGLLTSLGCSKIKALSVYLVSFIFLFLMSFAIAIPIGFFVVSRINNIYLYHLSSILYFFTISPLSIFISLMISLGVLILGVAYPLVRLFKMPVIKTIKGYKNN